MDESSSGASGRGALAEFTEAISDLFGQVADLGPKLIFGGGQPRHELIVEDDAVQVRVEMPGIDRDAIDVSVTGRKLTISTTRPRFKPPEGARLIRRERPSGDMQVTIQIPDETDARAVVANMKAGVLEVTLPKPSGRGRSIKVDEAKSQSRGAKGKSEPSEDAMPWDESTESTGDAGEQGAKE